jgi:deoxyribose-phosphate aldolase
MYNWLPDAVKIKASGGIRTREDAEALIAAGASRIGTSTVL